jgi:hypothetical protein
MSKGEHMRDTIDMAREANRYADTHADSTDCDWPLIRDERFAELVRADQDEKYKWDVHSCGPTCKRYACVAIREAVEAEREACAKLCETLVMGKHCAAAIRARGNT